MNCSEDGVPLVGLTTDVHLRPEELVGKIVEGRYKVERIIGKGGMGTVYACRHVVVGKVAAMKVLRTGVERGDGVLQRFVREAQTANLLRSRHIVEVSDFGQLPNGSFFVVMELLEGHDLAHAMRHGLDRAQLVHVFTQVADTLGIAHDKGIVHRDLKPDNVFLTTEGTDPLFVKLLDFGIAKILHGESNGGLTETGVILGTPYYMSPEQARAEAIDHRTDIYSMGVMMYRAFTGRLPFVADSTMGVLTRHITEAPEPPSRLVPMDNATERLILRAMAKHKDERFQSMREVVEALRQIPTGPVAAIAEHATVSEGRGGPPPSASYPGSTGQHQASTGGYARQHLTGQQATGQQLAGPPGGYTGQVQVAPSGAYAPALTGPQRASQAGPYPGQVPAGYPAPSGAYGAAPSGAYLPTPQVTTPQPGFPQASLPAIAGGASGAYAPASGAYAPPNSGGMGHAGHPGAPSGAYAAAVSGAFDARTAGPSAPPGSGETTRGLAATGAIPAPAPPSGNNTTTLLLGAVAMLSLGALGAVLLYQAGRPGAAAGGAASGAAASATVAATSTGPSASASASATPAPTASASAAADAPPSVPIPGPGPRPKAGGPLPKTAPSATATAAAKRTPRDIRSPFD
jgi:predicted Ser/Thr protein kinase